MSGSHDVTALLNRLCEGDAAAREEFAPVLHDELRRLARGQMVRERSNHTLRPTELVHDAWVRLIRPEGTAWENRRQFFSLASRTLRSLLVDHARKRAAESRGGGATPITLRTGDAADSAADLDVVDIDDALSRLTEIDPELGQITELRIFGGVEMTDVAELMDLPLRTAERRWRAARVWLRRELGDG